MPTPTEPAPSPEVARAAPPTETREPSPPSGAPAPPASSPEPRAAPGERAPATGGPQVAALPPSRDHGIDIRSALRGREGGGAGGLGHGRGGIEGEPIPLDSRDERYDEFLRQLRRKIQEKWGFPCVRNAATRECEYKNTSLVVEFGILKDGQLQFIEVVQSSGFPIYDEYAVTAIKLASPFPRVPAAMLARAKPGSTGVPIMAKFNYIVETSLTNLLR
jgi:protein TonB